MRRRFLLIDNPRSGYGSRRLVADVVDRLQRRGTRVDRLPSSPEPPLGGASHALRVATYDAVVAAGGDGTIRLAAKALLGTSTPLGVIPLGTGNVLAHEAGLPRSAHAIAELLLEGEARPVELAAANGEPFLLMAGVGFDGSVIGALDQAWKARLGKAAYALPVLRTLARRAASLSVVIEGNEYEATCAVLANARCYGGRFVIAESAGIGMPGLVAVLIEAASRAALAATLLALARGRLAERQNVRILPCREALVRAPLPVPVQIDGDAFATTPVTVKASAGQVRLILPPRSITA